MKCATLTLKNHLLVNDEVLGCEYESRIGGIECTIVMPAKGKGVTLQGPRDDSWPDRAVWGASLRSTVLLYAFGIVPLSVLNENDADNLVLAAVDWEAALRTWLSVLVDGPVELVELKDKQVMWSDLVVGREPQNHLPQLDADFKRAASEAQWRYAIRKVGEGAVPPLARSLLMSSLYARALGNWRAAVIDAATGVEVAISDVVRMRIGDPKLAEWILRNNSMLGRLSALVKELGVDLPGAIREDLIEVRNRVVHKGIQASEDEADRAIRVARMVIDAHVPIPIVA